ncbi:PfkB [Rubrobacter xylanophilus DSM 9941]|uniref:PfkB n=1 Tax=Rubrobacter xylanophilus (strain DSM 9941 / JCM 11954 / NBRC 16129 / PRD-1) TaxID=266117 RepID=Q1ASW3_RUBXD|nr:carbohydrate kinase family protein [Rubrobacter xylanophilus]ABG05515.1 PfkB [Rubrobacter xylanophilus DSM 9941]
MAERAVIAGHLCLDLIPRLPSGPDGFRFRPGALVPAGRATVSTGGCVPNTGLALHRLGAEVSLLGKVGDDPFGELVRGTLAREGQHLARDLLRSPGAHTSYSIVLSPPGEDRMILHYPGANDAFGPEDVPEAALRGAALFHFGYPPVMRRMYEDGGASLASLMSGASAAGLLTSLDMAYPDPASPAGRADWPRILARALPHVDVFLPSLEETLLMLRSEAPPGRARPQDIRSLAERLLSLGPAVVGLKMGERGIYLRTAAEERLARAGPPLSRGAGAWSGRELWSGAFETEAAGTTGAGDAAVAGFLFGLLNEMPPEKALTAACAAGACSVEAADATSGIRRWEEVELRIERGWRRRRPPVDAAWREADRPGLWAGPGDRCA